MTCRLPEDKKAAICFSIDDVHPSKSSDHYEAGGDLGKGALRHLEWLFSKHPQLKATAFVTADWREISSVPTRKILAALPYLRDRFFLAKILPKGKMSLVNNPAFVDYLNGMPQLEVAFHGLYHCHKGLNIPVEFQNESTEEIKEIFRRMKGIFNQSGIHYVNGICPPGWNASDNFLRAMADEGLEFISSARDIINDVSRDSLTNMSGLKGVSLIYPQKIAQGKVLHIPVNFQATSKISRAVGIIENGGLVSIKAHIIKRAFGRVALDGLDELYANYLDMIFSFVEQRYGDSIWWTSMGEISRWSEAHETAKVHFGANHERIDEGYIAAHAQ